MVDVQSGHREEGCRDNLYEEFLSVSHSHEVIGYTYNVQQCQSGDKEEKFARHLRGEHIIGNLVEHHSESGKDRKGKYNNRKECDTAETRDRTVMYLASIRLVEQLFF